MADEQHGTYTKGSQTRIAGSARDAVRLRASGWTRQSEDEVTAVAGEEGGTKATGRKAVDKWATPKKATRGRDQSAATPAPATEKPAVDAESSATQ